MRYWFAVALVAVLSPGAVRAADPPRPVCALLNLGKNSRVALAETRLLAGGEATWVERAGIDALVKEQHAQDLFGPQGVGERVRLGKLLKADLLVLVRPVTVGTDATLEVVASETAGGLRLLVRAVPVTADPAADVAALLAAVGEGVRRHGRAVREVVAVPPFLSRDLGDDLDHLKGAFAKLAEAAALARPGVVVVELAEAEALARELALTDPGAKLARPLPLYLLGEYRHAGRTVTLTLRAERGGKPVGRATERTLSPGEAPASIRAWAASVLDAPGGPAEQGAEVRQLVARFEDFRRLGNWDECAALAEAALLLDPDRAALRADAAAALGHLTRRALAVTSPARLTPAAVARAVRANARAREHAAWLAARTPAVPDTLAWRALAGWHALPVVGDDRLNALPPDAAALVGATRAADRARFLPLLPLIAARYPPGHADLVAHRLADGLPAKEAFATLERVALALAETPGAWAARYARPSFAAGVGYDGPEYRAFLDRLAASPTPAVQAVATDLRNKLDAGGKPVVTRPVLAPAPRAVPGGVTFRAVATVGGTEPLQGVVAAGPGVDVFWGYRTLYVMKEKGKLVPLPAAPFGVGEGFRPGGFDGKYVWLVGDRRSGWPALLVVDPAAEQVWEVTAADGLPRPTPATPGAAPPRQVLLAAPLDRGRAGVAGTLGGRAWVAVVTHAPDAGRPVVKVILEATEAQDRAAADQWKNPAVAFTPDYLVPLRGPDGVAPRLLLGRALPPRGGGTWNRAVTEHPLIIDPDAARVTVRPDPLTGRPAEAAGPDGQHRTRVGANVPPGTAVWVSAHYGRVVRDPPGTAPGGVRLHAVEVTGPPAR